MVGNWIFGDGGMLSYSGLAGSDNVQKDEAGGTASGGGVRNRLEAWCHDGTSVSHTLGPPVEFEHLDQGGTGPGSLEAFVAACQGKEYFVGAGATEGMKAVAAIDAMYRSAASGKPEVVRGCEGL